MHSQKRQEIFVPHATQNADNQLTLWGSQGFLYDLNGNMTADGNNAYAWNVRNQLVALTPDGGTANTFVYDAFGRRQRRISRRQGSIGGRSSTWIRPTMLTGRSWQAFNRNAGTTRRLPPRSNVRQHSIEIPNLSLG
jgi:YD repeat-containing protein